MAPVVLDSGISWGGNNGTAELRAKLVARFLVIKWGEIVTRVFS